MQFATLELACIDLSFGLCGNCQYMGANFFSNFLYNHATVELINQVDISINCFAIDDRVYFYTKNYKVTI